jgi:prevent-host-death family protein
MKTVSARQANHDFSELLSRVERGEEILITRRSRPVALLSPYRHSDFTCAAASRMRQGCAVVRARRFFLRTNFWLIFAPCRSYDEPEILPSSTHSMSLMNGGHEIVERSRPALLDSNS